MLTAQLRQQLAQRLPKLRSIPLRAVLIVPLVLELTATTGLIIALNTRNAENNARLTAEQLMLQASREVDVYLDGYMLAPQQVIRTMADAVTNGQVDPQQQQEVTLFLSKLARIFPSASYLNYALADSTLIGVGQATLENDKESFLELSKPSVDPVIRRYTIEADGARGTQVRSADFADFRTEDWYATPLKLGHPTWTSIYNWPDQPDVMVVSAGMPLKQAGRIIGLSGVDVFLSNISRYLEKLKISPHSVIYVAEPNGLLVATSTGALPFDIKNHEAIRRLASQDPEPLIRNSAKAILQRTGSFKAIQSTLKLHIDRGDNDLLVRASNWHESNGLHWIVVLAVPESDFTANIRAQTRLSLLLSVLIIAAAIALGWRLVQLISRPIEQVSAASEALANGVSNVQLPPTNILETNRLTSSFRSMATQLLGSMRALEDRNASMEAEIAARTEELRHANKALRKDVTIAAGIQQGMLIGEREVNAITPGLDVGVLIAPSKEVAGDLYDCIRIDARRWCICVGDVSGKGVPAALLMSTCLSLLRAYSETMDSPAAIMHRINQHLTHNNDSCAFTTMLIAILDGVSGELRWCNAGHNPPLLVRSKENVTVLSRVHGPALGAVEAVYYSEAREQLNINDTLFLYSDGASEMFNTQRQRYGMAQMVDFLAKAPSQSAPRLVRSMLRSLKHFANGEPQHDDITMMALRRIATHDQEQHKNVN